MIKWIKQKYNIAKEWIKDKIKRFWKIIVGTITIAGVSAAGLSLSVDNTIKIKDAYRLKCNIDKILEYKQIKDYRIKNNDIVYVGNIIKYDYISDEIIKATTIKYKSKTIQEDINKRTTNSLHYKIGKNKYIGKFYSGMPFYKSGNTWYLVKTATTTIDAFNLQISKANIFDKLKFYIIRPVMADIIYAGAGDGVVYNESTISWSDCKTATVGLYVASAVGSNDNFYQHGYDTVNSKWKLGRQFFPMDTSSIPDDAIITDATFNAYYYQYYSGGSKYLAVGRTTQPDVSTLTLDDFDQVDLSVEGSNRVLVDATAATKYTFILNSNGISWINKTGYTKLGVFSDNDWDNNDLNYSRIVQYYNESLTAKPYLEVFYITPVARNRILIIN